MTENLRKILEKVLEHQVENCVDAEKILALYVDGIVAALLEDWPKQRAHDEAHLSGFRERLMLLWNEPLTLFRILLTCSLESFGEYADSLDLERAKTKKGVFLREALYFICGRMLRTATAARLLLEHGMADDAYARCRTLCELYVTGSFVSDHGDEAGRLYLEHDAVGLRKRLKRESAWGTKDIPNGLAHRIEADYQRVIRIHGESFGNDYGWASKFLPGKNGRPIANPKIEQIARATLPSGSPAGHPPFYVESSFQVHAGITGALGVASGSEPILAVGHSNTGLELPLISASQWIARTSALLQDHSPSSDEAMKYLYSETFFRLEAMIAEGAIRCAEEVERETLRRKRQQEPTE